MEYTDKLMESLDFTALDELSAVYDIRFSDLVSELISGGIFGFDYTKILTYIRGVLFAEIEANRAILAEVVLLAVAFSVLKNFLGTFERAYVAEMCYMLVYSILALLMVQSAAGLKEITSSAVNTSVSFMQTLIPVYCLVMVFANGSATSLGFYQTAFIVIYVIEWLFLKILMPLIHIFILVEICDHYSARRRFGSLAALLESAISGGMKLALSAVFALGVVQNLISPAKDALTKGAIWNAASMLPGVGNIAEGIGELLTGAGMLIKGSAGVAALAVLTAICVSPWLKLVALSALYKLAAAVCEPVCDERISGCLSGVGKGGVLYVKLLGYSEALFAVTVGLAAASGRSLS